MSPRQTAQNIHCGVGWVRVARERTVVRMMSASVSMFPVPRWVDCLRAAKASRCAVVGLLCRGGPHERGTRRKR
jgi:hypothetical protein